MRIHGLVALSALFLSMATIPAVAGDAPPLPLKQVADVPLTGKATRLDYQSLDPKTHLLFIAHLGDGVVHVVNTETRKVVADIADVAQVHGVLAVPELGRVYATATGSKGVVAIDEKTLKIVARIPATGYPDGLAYDPGTMKLYISDEERGDEVVIDMRENRRVGTIALGGEAGNTQYDPASKHIFVNIQTTNELVEIDPATDKVVSRVKLDGADGNHGLFIDADRRLAFAACEGNSTLLVIDMTTKKVVQSFPVGKGVDVLAFDPGRRWLYASSESGTVSIFEVGAKEEPTRRTVRKAFEGFVANNAHTVAVDPATHRAYFPLKNVGGKPVLRIMEVSTEHAGVQPHFEGEEVGKAPAGFTTALTGGGGPVAWAIVDDKSAPNGSKALAQTSQDDTDYRFPLCVYDDFTAKDVSIEVRFKPVEGKVDQAAGIVGRYQDSDNYYVTRANALEDNVRLYHVVKGKRKQFAGTNVKVESGKWHTLKLIAKGQHFQVYFDGALQFEADDDTFTNSGKVGLWTKADSVTYFDDLMVESLDDGVVAAAPKTEAKPGRDGDGDDDDDEAVKIDQKIGELQDRAVKAITAKRYDEAVKLLGAALELVPNLPADARDEQAQLAHYNLACALSLQGKKAPAVEHFVRALERGFQDWEHIAQDTDLDNVRDEPGFKKAIDQAKAGEGEKEAPKKNEPRGRGTF